MKENGYSLDKESFMKTLFLLIATLISLNTFAGFDVHLTPKKIIFLTRDNHPVPQLKFLYEAQAEHLAFTTWGCGVFIPVPGYCWHPSRLIHSIHYSDQNGAFNLEEKTFTKKSENWANLEISITGFGIKIQDCPLVDHLDLYVKPIYNQQQQIDLTKKSEIIYRIDWTHQALLAKIQEAREHCAD